MTHDDSRMLPPYYRGQPYFFVENNRGKKGITVDIGKQTGTVLEVDDIVATFAQLKANGVRIVNDAKQ
ncbi:MAG: hypothetical protein EPO21_00415 [Chloroflexota bacterium]|nr:MAG: hypothetical protein EPO21_00415 [Chloroflexota bacterium]